MIVELLLVRYITIEIVKKETIKIAMHKKRFKMGYMINNFSLKKDKFTISFVFSWTSLKYLFTNVTKRVKAGIETFIWKLSEYCHEK